MEAPVQTVGSLRLLFSDHKIRAIIFKLKGDYDIGANYRFERNGKDTYVWTISDTTGNVKECFIANVHHYGISISKVLFKRKFRALIKWNDIDDVDPYFKTV